jgi:hypothetical protein
MYFTDRRLSEKNTMTFVVDLIISLAMLEFVAFDLWLCKQSIGKVNAASSIGVIWILA